MFYSYCLQIETIGEPPGGNQDETLTESAEVLSSGMLLIHANKNYWSNENLLKMLLFVFGYLAPLTVIWFWDMSKAAECLRFILAKCPGAMGS